MPYNFQANTFSPYAFRSNTFRGGAATPSVTHSGWFRLLLTELQSASLAADEVKDVEGIEEQPKLTSHIVTPEERKLLAKKQAKRRAILEQEVEEERRPTLPRKILPDRIVSAYEAFGLPLIDSINATRSEVESLALQWKLKQESEDDEVVEMLLMTCH